MTKQQLSGGLVHDLPSDLAKAIASDPRAVAAWEDISIKARNEWICWTVTVKQAKTRAQHVGRARNELAQGKRRPCCWIGCIHRTDKAISPSVQGILNSRQSKAK